MKEIPLTQGQVALVDDEDFEELNRYKWCLNRTPGTGTIYAVRQGSKVNGKWPMILMHRVIMNAKKGEEVDHINHNNLDNRRSNLRIASKSDNQHNKRKMKNNTSGFKGVSIIKNRYLSKPYQAIIMVNRKQMHIGYYSTLEEAARAYDKKALEFHGEFACVNFSEGD